MPLPYFFAMVLSNKKLKRKLRLEVGAQPSTREDSPPRRGHFNKREKKRQRQQEDAEGGADASVDQAEMDRYHQCIQRVLHKHDGAIDKERKRNEEALPNTTNVEMKKANAIDRDDHNLPEKLQGSISKKPKVEILKIANEINKNFEQQEGKLADHQSAEDQDLIDPRTIYVGGIPYSSSEDDIRAFFGDCGTISTVNSKTFPDSGKFRGIALLTFKTEGGAQRALALNGANMGSCFLKIQPSAASKPKETLRKEVYKEAPSKTDGYTRAYIGNLSWDITEQDVRGIFKDCKVDAVRFSLDKTTGEFQGFGHVDFADDESLELALQLDQQNVLGRPIKVAYAVPKPNENNKGKTFRDKKDKTCYLCGEKGHISSHCFNTGK